MEETLDTRDKILLDEARRCQEAGALRAAFILTWIAVAEGLRWRFREMSLRDGQMARWMTETDRQEASGATIDQRLLDHAKTSGLVSEPEFRKLSYLKDMRNSFAHPTGEAPTAAEVSAALQVAVDVVLSRPPLLGHGFARELTENLFTDLHYLDDVEDKVTSYIDQLCPLLHPDVIPWLVEQIITRLDAILADPQLALFARRAIWFGRQLLASADVDASPRWRIESMLISHPLAACLIAGDIRVFPRLGERLGDMIFGWLAEPAPAGRVVQPSVVALTMLISLDDADLLDERQQQRLTSAIGNIPYSILEQGAPFRVWARRIIDELGTHNWYVQNPAASALNDIGPKTIESCDSSILESLGRALLAAADGTAKDAVALISRLYYNDGREWPADFIRGLLLETVLREDGTFRVKPDLLPKVAVIVTDHPAGELIISTVANAIRDAAPDRDAFDVLYEVRRLDAIDTPAAAQAVRALADAARPFGQEDEHDSEEGV